MEVFGSIWRYIIIYKGIWRYMRIYPQILTYTSKYPILRIWGPTWDPKMVITRTPERLPKWEFGTKLPTMSPEALAHPKGAQIYFVYYFWEVLGCPPEAIILLIGLPRGALVEPYLAALVEPLRSGELWSCCWPWLGTTEAALRGYTEIPDLSNLHSWGDLGSTRATRAPLGSH